MPLQSTVQSEKLIIPRSQRGGAPFCPIREARTGRAGGPFWPTNSATQPKTPYLPMNVKMPRSNLKLSALQNDKRRQLLPYVQECWETKRTLEHYSTIMNMSSRQSTTS